MKYNCKNYQRMCVFILYLNRNRFIQTHIYAQRQQGAGLQKKESRNVSEILFY